MTPLTGFRPDADPTTPGVVVDCLNVVPTQRGLAASKTLSQVVGTSALAADARGLAVTTDTVGTTRLYAGVQTQLYEMVGLAWTGRSRSGGYTGSLDNRWSFAQFGNATLASNDTEPIQAAVSGSSFADIAGAPKAKIIIGAENFVIALNTNEATYGDQSDRWWCSAFQDHTSWAPSIATQANTGRLIGAGGEITAGLLFGSQPVAYKARSIFVGSYVGSPVVWQWDRVPGEVGCIGQDAVCDVNGAHVFVGEDNIWRFDGTRPVPLEGSEWWREWWFNDSAPQYRYKTTLTFDRQTGLLWIHYVPSTSSDGKLTKALVYHTVRKEAAVVSIPIQAVANWVSPGVSIDAGTGTMDSSDLPFDSALLGQGAKIQAYISSRLLMTLTGTPGTSTLTTGDYGDDFDSTMLRRLRLRFLRSPSTASASGLKRDNEGGSRVVASSGSINDNKFDLRQTARWHGATITMTGDWEATGLGLDWVKAGSR